MNVSKSRPTNGVVAELPSLTGLRGIAALWVVLYHYGIRYFPTIRPDHYGFVIERGYLAVDLFFLLSGFVLSHVYMARFATGQQGQIMPFINARVARLYPLHVIVVFFFVLTSVSFGDATGDSNIPYFGPHSIAALIANLFMVQGLKASELSWNYPAWSISVEFLAYLGFPFAAALISKARARMRILFLGCLLTALVWVHYRVGGNFNQWDGFPAFLRCIPEFFIGMLLYTFAEKRRIWLGSNVMLSVILCGLFVSLQFRYPDLCTVLLFVCLVPVIVNNSGRAKVMLNCGPMVLLGELSYSLYLVHGLVQQNASQLLVILDISDQNLSAAIAVLLMSALVVASLLLAFVSHRYFEMPARRYLRRVLSRLEQATPPHAHSELAQAK